MNDVNKNILDAILDTEDAKEAVTYARKEIESWGN